GSTDHQGAGELRRLVTAIRTGELALVVALARWIGHPATALLSRTCRQAGVSFLLWSRGVSSLAEELERRRPALQGARPGSRSARGAASRSPSALPARRRASRLPRRAVGSSASCGSCSAPTMPQPPRTTHRRSALVVTERSRSSIALVETRKNRRITMHL